MKSNVIETVIGASVILIAVGFFTFVYKTTDVRAGSGGYELSAQFDSISGITVGSDIRIAGVKVGSVVGQTLDTDAFEAVVTMTIDPMVKLPTDASAKGTSDGLLGDNYISIEPGGDDNILAAGGRIEHTQGAVDLFDLIREFLFKDDEKKAEE